MTLSRFSPETLDALALRVLDLAGMLREMAKTAREKDVRNFELNANKAHEWLSLLERWGLDAQHELAVEVAREMGARRAEAARPRSRKKAKR
ncbi:MAG TPA: hypothetical protein VGJ26_08950 [Pirellulales bacterium]|jgi:hypothetical protein